MTNLSQLKEFKRIIIQCHDNPDADALACAFAVSEYLRECGRQAEIIYGGFAPLNKASLRLMTAELGITADFIDKNAPPDYSGEKDTLLLLVDGQYGAGNVKKINAAAIGILDHHVPEARLQGNLISNLNHPKPDSKTAETIQPTVIFSDIRPFLGSCSTLIWLLLKNSGFKFENNIKASTALYYGLYTDTGGLAEITHPLDKDMRDHLSFDKPLIKKLKNCNLSLSDLTLAGKSLTNARISSETQSALFVAEPCDPNILGFISDLALQTDSIDTCVVFCEVSGGIKLSVRSCVKEVMAFELASELCRGGGSGGGHNDKAGGFISENFISKSSSVPTEFLTNRYNEYFKAYDLFYAGKYKPDLEEFKQYVKLKIPVGYTKTTDIFPHGTQMQIRTLEGDAHVKSDMDTYIMVGIRQEVYPIKREKFIKTYKPLEGEYKPMTEYFLENHYPPSVKNSAEGVSENIEKYIRPCVALGETKIYAKQLTKSAKVFTDWYAEGYMFGKPGDWLVARCDDLNDIYIVENKIFELTYAPADR